ncbi:MAG TPA: tRNA lysidine(34) synthetase TilS [Lacipirellulaceae bacterium]|jgi:tRNA(Ile)-lysidine synthase|nr:tRNA lysidine(34) synthetase TilS [Lacipirellulaceae bacterium]
MNSIQENDFERRVAAAWPVEGWRDSHVVLGVSGGADSVAMLRAVLAIKAVCGGNGQLFVAHFNHGVRGAEADADQDWLGALCRQLNLPFETARAEPVAIQRQGDGWEAAARTARYGFLLRIAERLGARFVAVAHTADDQVETVLHRILRGTGLAGLAGIRPSRPLSPSVALVRPLLGTTRREVLAYLADIGQDYRVDPTNWDTRRTRNRLRHELLPLMRDTYNFAVDEALRRLALQAGEAEEVIAGAAEQIARDCIAIERGPQPKADSKGLKVRLDCRGLHGVPMIVTREVCRAAWREAGWPMQAMGFDEWQAIAELVLQQRSTPVNLPDGLQARCVDEMVVIAARN